MASHERNGNMCCRVSEWVSEKWERTRRNDKNGTMRVARTQQQLRFKNEPKSKLVVVLFRISFLVRKQLKQITQIYDRMAIVRVTFMYDYFKSIGWYTTEKHRERACDEQVNFLIVQFVHMVFSHIQSLFSFDLKIHTEFLIECI